MSNEADAIRLHWAAHWKPLSEEEIASLLSAYRRDQQLARDTQREPSRHRRSTIWVRRIGIGLMCAYAAAFLLILGRLLYIAEVILPADPKPTYRQYPATKPTAPVVTDE